MATVHHIYHGVDCQCDRCKVAKNTMVYDVAEPCDPEEFKLRRQKAYELRCKIVRDTDENGNYIPGYGDRKQVKTKKVKKTKTKKQRRWWNIF